MGRPEGLSGFPHPAYAQAVLKPLFEGTRRQFLSALSRVNRAHCVMLGETGILSRPQAASIASALADVEQNIAGGRVDYVPAHEDVFFAIEALLAERVGVDLAGRLHTGRSRNDMDHTIFRLELRRRLDEVISHSLDLAEVTLAKAVREAATIIVAYTHGQPAQPTTFGHYLFGALEVLLRDIERIEAARDIVDRSPMGAAAITTTGFPIDRRRMARLLGFSAPTGNSYASIAGVDYLTSTYSSLKLLFLHLGRVIQDMQFWSSFEVAQLHVPDGFVQISSIMPQKRNPVAIEHLRLLASAGAGDAETMLSIMHNTPFTDMNDSEGGAQLAGYRAFDGGGRMLGLLSSLIGTVSVASANVRRNIDRSCIAITELADELVRSEGLSFREAHDMAAEVTKGVLESGGTLQGAGYGFLEKAFHGKAARSISMTPEAFACVVSAEHFVLVRERPGGPGPGAMNAAAEDYRASIAALHVRRELRAQRIAEGDHELEAGFARLLADQA